MGFSITDEHEELHQVLRDFFAEIVSFDELRSRLHNQSAQTTSATPPRNQVTWDRMKELGLFQSFASESADERATFRTLAVVAFESGRALLAEGLVDALLAGPFLMRTLLEEPERLRFTEFLKQNELKPPLDESTLASMHWTGQSGSLLKSPAGKSSFRSGTVAFAPWAASSSMLIAIGPEAEPATAVLLKGAKIEERPLLDPSVRAFHVALKDAPSFSFSLPVTQALRDGLRVLRACEICGCMSRAVEMTTQHVSTREQFGVPVGGFQAVQHKLADMFLHSESLLALTRFAAWCSEHSPEQRSFASIAALQQALRNGPGVLESAIQLHGGIGFTHEYDLHFLLRRVKYLEAHYRMTEPEVAEVLSLCT
jgi:alkylation response protein AidB-like acyl-CoA dehydrogenase